MRQSLISQNRSDIPSLENISLQLIIPNSSKRLDSEIEQDIKISYFNYLNSKYLREIEKLKLINEQQRQDLEFILSDFIENFNYEQEYDYSQYNDDDFLEETYY